MELNLEHERRLLDLFEAAADQPPSSRREYLHEACGDDQTLVRAVESMLAAECEVDTFVSAIEAPVPWRGREPTIGDAISRFTLRRVIASGGMGTVFEAEQRRPHRIVALKILKRGTMSASARRRFESESEILGRLRHPAIAQVYESGTHDEGREVVSYFAMELVPGALSLTQYAEEHDLDLRARIELFIGICEAVAHAHRKGIIHRDLKPSNILVDESGHPKIIDFGIARVADPALTIARIDTNPGEVIGTLRYMSPEQCGGDPNDVDTTSDVYTLGVVLFELLCGVPPYETTDVSLADVICNIRKHPPARPGDINRALRGDLETILLKTLEKDRSRRYGGALDLAADLRRHLDDEPIAARPPTLAYQLAKLARRHRTAFAAAALAVLALLASAFIAGGFAIRERHARAVAERQTGISAQLNLFLNNDVLAAADPAVHGPEARLVDVLAAAAASIEGRFEDEPLIEAALRRTVGNAFYSLALYDRGEPHLREALRIRKAELGAAHVDTLMSMSDLGRLLESIGEFGDAEVLLEQALATAERTLGADHPGTLVILNNLGVAYDAQGRIEEAGAHYARVLEARTRRLGADHPSTIEIGDNLATLYTGRGDYERAEAILLETIEARRSRLGADHPKTLLSSGNLGGLYYNMGRFEESATLQADTLERQRRVLGPRHSETLMTMHNLALVSQTLGRNAEAERLFIETIGLKREVLGGDHPATLESKSMLATFYDQIGREAEAEPLYVETLEEQRSVLGGDHGSTLATGCNLAILRLEQGRFDDAERLLVGALDARERTLGASHRDTLANKLALAYAYQVNDRLGEAETLLVEVREEQWRQSPTGEHPDMTLTAINLGDIYLTQQRYGDAERLFDEAVHGTRGRRGFEDQFAGAVTGLGMSRAGAGRHEDAIAPLVDGYEALKAIGSPIAPIALAALIESLEAIGRDEEAAKWRAPSETPRDLPRN